MLLLWMFKYSNNFYHKPLGSSNQQDNAYRQVCSFINSLYEVSKVLSITCKTMLLHNAASSICFNLIMQPCIGNYYHPWGATFTWIFFCVAHFLRCTFFCVAHFLRCTFFASHIFCVAHFLRCTFFSFAQFLRCTIFAFHIFCVPHFLPVRSATFGTALLRVEGSFLGKCQRYCRYFVTFGICRIRFFETYHYRVQSYSLINQHIYAY